MSPLLDFLGALRRATRLGTAYLNPIAKELLSG